MERDLVPAKEGEARARGRSGEIKERDAQESKGWWKYHAIGARGGRCLWVLRGGEGPRERLPLAEEVYLREHCRYSQSGQPHDASPR